MRFKIVEIRESGVTVTHYLRGKPSDVKRDIESYKQQADRYELFGNEGMVVWA
jgi:hypothetical protein